MKIMLSSLLCAAALALVLVTHAATASATAADGACDAADGTPASSMGCSRARGSRQEDYSNEQDGFEAYRAYVHRDPFQDYNKMGVSRASSGDIDAALDYFRAASHHSAFRGDVWSNVGLALQDLAKREARGSAKRKSMLREARAAFLLGAHLENEGAKNSLTRLEAAFRQEFPKAYLGESMAASRLDKRVLQLIGEGRHIDAVNAYCKSEESVVVQLAQEDRTGPLSAFTAWRFFLTMRVCGVAVLRNVFPQGAIDAVESAYEPRFEAFEQQLKDWDGRGVLEWRDAASRDKKRFEVKFRAEEAFTNEDVTANQYVLAMAKLMLGDRLELDTLSTVTSLPDAPNQSWHADVGSIFSRHIRTADRHLPPTGLVVIIPLVDVTDENGPTQFMAGSHVSLGFDYWANRDESNCPTPLLRPEAQRGDAVIFDLRIYHRGTANRSKSKRPITYMSYVRDWYFDKVNFKDSQSRGFDALTMQQKKLFARLDQQTYIRQLEEQLEARGVDVARLQSQGGYKKVDMRV